MTTHWSKPELKMLRYLEKCAGFVNSFLEAITFDLTILFSKSQVFWKLDIHIFPMPLESIQSKFRKAFKWLTEVRIEKLEEKTKLFTSA